MLRKTLVALITALVIVPAASALTESDNVLTISPNPYRLGGVRVGTTVAPSFTLRNVSSEPQTIQGYEAFGTNGNFLILPGTCFLGQVLQPGGACTFSLRVQPSQPGRISGTFCYSTVGPTLFTRECATVRGHALPR